MGEVWEETEQIYDGRKATVDDEESRRVSKMSKGRLKLGLVVAEFSKVDFDNVEGFEVSEVGESVENVVVPGFVRRRVAHPPNVRRQNLSPFFRDILAPSLELRLELETDMVEEMALALRKPSFRDESAGFERSAEVVTRFLSNAVDDSVNDLLVVANRGHVGRVDPRRGDVGTSALNGKD